MAGAGNAEEPVPWHRVINAQGAISDRGDFGRAQDQRQMLEAEGVEFNDRGRIDLARFRYAFPDFEWPDNPVDP